MDSEPPALKISRVLSLRVGSLAFRKEDIRIVNVSGEELVCGLLQGLRFSV